MNRETSLPVAPVTTIINRSLPFSRKSVSPHQAGSPQPSYRGRFRHADCIVSLRPVALRPALPRMEITMPQVTVRRCPVCPTIRVHTDEVVTALNQEPG